MKNVTPKICILTSENLKQEVIKAVTESEDFDDVTVATYPSRCGYPPIQPDELTDTIGHSNTYSRIHVIGGCCIAKLRELGCELEKYQFHKVDQCFDMLASKTLIDRYLQQGAYLITPGWVAHWPKQVERWGFDQDTAQSFFREFCTKLVLFDTGVDPNSNQYIQEFANFVDRPFEVIPIGLDFFKSFLTKMVRSPNFSLAAVQT